MEPVDFYFRGTCLSVYSREGICCPDTGWHLQTQPLGRGRQERARLFGENMGKGQNPPGHVHVCLISLRPLLPLWALSSIHLENSGWTGHWLTPRVSLWLTIAGK